MTGSELLVLNPRGRRKRVRGKRRKARARRTNPTRRRRRRAAPLMANTRRRRRAHARRRTNPRRRRVHRNPGGRLLGVNVNQIVMLTAGAIVTEVLADKLAQMLPASWATPEKADMIRIGTKAAVGIGVPLLARRFLPRGWGNAIAIGGGIVTLFDIVKTYVAPHVPGLHLTGYEIGPTSTGIATDRVGFTGYTQEGLSDATSAYGGDAYQ